VLGCNPAVLRTYVEGPDPAFPGRRAFTTFEIRLPSLVTVRYDFEPT
jgi:hypothetical protein